MATLRDVAARAGVSTQTVSNVVHGKTSEVGAATIERVQQAIAELKYQPSMVARQLRSGRGGAIALVVPDLINPYFAKVAMHVISAAAEHGYTVLIDYTAGSAEAEMRALESLRQHMISGAIFSPLALGVDELVAHAGKTPVVLLGEHLFGSPYDHVDIDNVEAARVATAHLLALGRRRIAAIGTFGDGGENTSRLRLQGYAEALSSAGIPLDPDLTEPVPSNSMHRFDGAQAMRRLLARGDRPDGVFCFTDLLALGAMPVLHEAGLRIPEDMAVVGFDDIEEAQLAYPPLTTIAVSTQETCDHAVSLLVQRIDGARSGAPVRMQPPFELVARASTIGAARASAARDWRRMEPAPSL
jgi:DNA-binding LacI/PurR family transcriptional regulator